MKFIMNNARTLPLELPMEYRILPESIEFSIPGFRRFYNPGDKTLALRQCNCEDWYNEFIGKIVCACGRQYLPVCWLSDVEFLFALGHQPPDMRLPWTPPTVSWVFRAGCGSNGSGVETNGSPCRNGVIYRSRYGCSYRSF